MNKITKEQLNKCTSCDLSNFNEITNEYFIPKRTDARLEKNKEYILELSDKAFSKDFYVNINWNKNRVPKSKYYHCEILEISGRVARISGISYDLENDKDTFAFWDGFVSTDHIKIIKEL